MLPLDIPLCAFADHSSIALTNQVKELLSSVESSDAKIGLEFEQLKNALGTGSDNGLITRLAEGLQQFIGYDGQPGGKIQAEKGIDVSNLPVERLREAVLMFIAPFLGVLKYNHPELKR
ncbi:ProP effector [Babesia caballi]|uniref:ProP effector n=1 Tax=Babesia caballi TaxID=5871 RepID=A0AAV4LYG5_BABCB|nr:ProP effector [Babesia caballi]GIX64808.1 ProP effector [Babesia caballi]